MSYRMNVYLSNDGLIGHMYIGLVDANGIETKYGFHPIEDGKPWPTYEGAGIVKINEQTSGANWQDDYKSSFDLTEQQYQAALNKAQQIQQTPGLYNGVEGEGRNCVSTINQFASAGGQSQGIGAMFDDSVLNQTLAGWYADMIYGGSSIVGYVLPVSAVVAIMSEMTAYGYAAGLIPGGAVAIAIAAGVTAAIAAYFTPIALDLNGSGGINTYSSTSSLNKAFFDMDNDMFREKVQWLNPVDGWLAMDRNGDGLITNQRELFGDSDGKLAYQKLAELNTNNTGSSANAITNADAAWNNLRVWIDADIDGISDAGELKTLNELNITSISLETTPKKGTFAMNDNTPLLFPYFLVA